MAISKVLPKEQSPQKRIQQTFVAGENISALRCVQIVNNQVFLCDNNTNFEKAIVSGVALTSALTGNDVIVVLSGEIDDSSFSFSPNELLYLTNNGIISSVANTTGFLTVIGKSLGGNKILVEIDQPIIL